MFAYLLLPLFFGFFFNAHKDLSELLDKPKHGRELRSFHRSLGDAPDDIYRSADVYYESYYSKGISFCYDYDDRLRALFVYAESSDKYQPYRGELPHGLAFTLTRRQIEQKFGQPDYSGVLRYKNSSWALYKSRGFSISYLDTLASAAAHPYEISFHSFK